MKKHIAGLLVLFAAIAAPASAADFATSAPTTPLYAGIQVNDSGAGTFFGGYKLDKMFSGELSYSQYNSYASSIALQGVASFPVAVLSGNPLSAFGKIGVARTTVEIPSFCFGGACTPSYTDSTTDLVWGGGAQYDFGKRFSVRSGVSFGKYKNSELYVSGLVNF